MQTTYYVALAFVTVTLYATLTVMSKKSLAFIPPFAFIALSMAVLSVVAASASLAFERGFNLAALLTIDRIVFIVIFAIINLVSFGLLLRTMTGLPVAHYQLIAAAAGPLVAAGLGYFFLAENVSLRFIMAIPVVIVGLYIALGKG